MTISKWIVNKIFIAQDSLVIFTCRNHINIDCFVCIANPPSKLICFVFYSWVSSSNFLSFLQPIFDILAVSSFFKFIAERNQKPRKIFLRWIVSSIVAIQNCHLTNFSNRFSYSGFMKAMANLVYLVDIVLIHRYGLKKSKYLL